jgi:hypothetical protein
MDQKKDIRIVSTLLLLTGINTCKTNNLSKKILHKIYVFLIRYIRLTTLEDLTHLIPFISFLNHIVSISCTWLLLMQNLMFSRDLDQVFREFSAIDRILGCNFQIKIGYAGIRKNFHIICFGVFLFFVVHVVISIWISFGGPTQSVLLFVGLLNVMLICLLFGYICYNIILRIRLLQSFITRNRSGKYNIEIIQKIFIHILDIVKIANQYFGLKFLVVFGNF